MCVSPATRSLSFLGARFSPGTRSIHRGKVRPLQFTGGRRQPTRWFEQVPTDFFI
jgi:hypothetical protein